MKAIFTFQGVWNVVEKAHKERMNQRKQRQDEQDVQAMLAKFSIKYKKIIMLEVVVDNHVEEIADMDINMGVAMEEVIKTL
ncbi:conserved hypothetical protein [Ricinus communis]|uniref:Uncharacterized protein n=1 Tax=Ricinus communis TaxID=3988 RepID=B9RWU4_RICCO|nr:conserved hypothetical protein [Ricinus communis]